MNHVIEHVHDPVSMLKECHRILKEGGRLVAITPNIRSWGHRIYQRAWRGLEPPRHLQIFSRPSLTASAVQAGFRVCDCRAISRAAKSILLASHSLRTPDTRPANGAWGLWAEFMAIAEWAGACLDRDAGEEVALVAAK
jgi:SAM-dependent methyltransferase